jgi:hypothetical protein
MLNLINRLFADTGGRFGLGIGDWGLGIGVMNTDTLKTER